MSVYSFQCVSKIKDNSLQEVYFAFKYHESSFNNVHTLGYFTCLEIGFGFGFTMKV